MQSMSLRIRRAGERAPQPAPRGTSLRAVPRRTREPRRHTGRRRSYGGAAVDAAALHERSTDGYVQALGCLVWAAFACDPRVPLEALCDAAAELFERNEPGEQAEFVARVLRLGPEELAERAQMVVAFAAAPARAARYVELAAIRQAHADGAGEGPAAELAGRALGLVLDPFNALAEVLPRAIELAARAARQHDGYAPLVAALTSAHEAELGE